MEWGPEIYAINDGVMPSWIDAQDRILCKWYPSQDWFGPFSAQCVCGGWGVDFKIKLPANHAYYKGQENETVTIKVMTTDEVRDLLEKHVIEWDMMEVMDLLSDLGLMRDVSPVEIFERQHGGLDNNQRDILEAFIEWQENQQD